MALCLPATPRPPSNKFRNSLSAIPGGADRALTPAQRLRLIVTWSAVFGGVAAGLMMVYRTFLRPHGILGAWNGPWTSWFFGTGRREL